MNMCADGREDCSVVSCCGSRSERKAMTPDKVTEEDFNKAYAITEAKAWINGEASHLAAVQYEIAFAISEERAKAFTEGRNQGIEESAETAEKERVRARESEDPGDVGDESERIREEILALKSDTGKGDKDG